MKQYFIHDGKNQLGPFDIDGLKLQQISADTHIWYEGLESWMPAGKIQELKELFTTPPPFTKSSIASFSQTPSYSDYTLPEEKKPYLKPLIIGCSVLIVAIVLTVLLFNDNKTKAASIHTETYEDTSTKAYTDQQRLQELEAKEKRRQAINEERTKKNMEYRNNWSKYLQITANEPKIDYTFGGIYNLEVFVYNNTDKIIDEVIVTVDYYLKSGEFYKSNSVTISTIQLGSYGSSQIPDANRGIKFETRITKITSRSLHFCYDAGFEGSFGGGISGNEKDPWFCK